MSARLRTAGVGALCGALAALAATVLAVLLRTGLGVPLPLELVSDLLIPRLSVDRFLHLVGQFGGFVAGKRIGFQSFFAGQVVAGAALGAVWALLLDHRDAHRRRLVTGIAVLVAWLVSVAALFTVLDSNYRGVPPGRATVASALSLLAVLLLFAVALEGFRTLARAPGPRPEGAAGGPRLGRQAFVLGASGALLAVAAGGLATRLYRRSAIGYDGSITRAPQLDPVTPIDRHYVVTKNFVDPQVDASRWRLELAGEVDRPRTYTLDELRALGSVDQPTTLECISNGVGGGLISNARWRGVPLRALLGEAVVRPGASHVYASGVDGFGHGLTLAKALQPTTLVAFGVDGGELPDRHGYPARLLVPGSYGEVSVKWVERIEVLDEARKGFYERQGWRAEVVHTMSRIDRPLGLRDLRAGVSQPVNGVAFAGDRGVDGVELSTDGGRTWAAAQLDYRGSNVTWALWSSAWTPDRPGRHELVVRATDGEGRRQTAEEDGIAPDGATGLHRIGVRVVA